MHDDPLKRMPWMSEPLSPSEIAALKRWIEAGASWPEGLTVALAAPAAQAPPPVRAAAQAHDLSHLQFIETYARSWPAIAYACHGPDRNNRQAGLRLDPDESRRMPHLSSGKDRLRPEQVATLRRWIGSVEAPGLG